MKATVTSVSQSAEKILVTLEVAAPPKTLSTTKGTPDVDLDYSAIFALQEKNTDGTPKEIDVSAFTVSPKAVVAGPVLP